MHYPWKHYYTSSLLPPHPTIPLPLVGTQRCSLCTPQRSGPEFHVYYVFGGKGRQRETSQQFKILASCYIERLFLRLQAVNICWEQTCLNMSVHVTSSWNILLSAGSCDSPVTSSCLGNMSRVQTVLAGFDLLATCFHDDSLLGLFFNPKHGGDMSFRNVRWLYSVISQKIRLF
jgi:hypothetical protein